jgi:hypothetical protein
MNIVGAFAPTMRSSTWLTLKLAADEINAAGGVLSRAGDQPLVVVLCEDSSDALDPAMDHLVRDLGVRALVGSLADEALHAAVERSATKGNALFFSPNGADASSASGIEAEQLLWYWGAVYELVVPVYPVLLERLLSSGAKALTPDDYRIALLTSPDREDQRLADAASAALSVGGVGFDDLVRFGRLRRFVLAPGSPVPDEMADYAPDLVLIFAGGHDAQSPYLERGLAIEQLQQFEAAHPGRRPIYLLGPRSSYDVAVESALVGSSDLRSRTLLVSADRALDPVLTERLAARFAAAYPALPAPAAFRASNPVYDTLYYLALALDAASAAGAQGAGGVRDALLRLSDATGEPVVVGPSTWDEARQSLRSNGRLNLSGSNGAAAFDADARARSGPPAVRCWNEDGRVVSRATYDAATALLSADAPACAEAAF